MGLKLSCSLCTVGAESGYLSTFRPRLLAAVAAAGVKKPQAHGAFIGVDDDDDAFVAGTYNPDVQRPAIRQLTDPARQAQRPTVEQQRPDLFGPGR